MKFIEFKQCQYWSKQCLFVKRLGVLQSLLLVHTTYTKEPLWTLPQRCHQIIQSFLHRRDNKIILPLAHPLTPTSSGHRLMDQDVPTIIKAVLDALPRPTCSSDSDSGQTSSCSS